MRTEEQAAVAEFLAEEARLRKRIEKLSDRVAFLSKENDRLTTAEAESAIEAKQQEDRADTAEAEANRRREELGVMLERLLAAEKRLAQASELLGKLWGNYVDHAYWCVAREKRISDCTCQMGQLYQETKAFWGEAIQDGKSLEYRAAINHLLGRGYDFQSQAEYDQARRTFCGDE